MFDIMNKYHPCIKKDLLIFISRHSKAEYKSRVYAPLTKIEISLQNSSYFEFQDGKFSDFIKLYCCLKC